MSDDPQTPDDLLEDERPDKMDMSVGSHGLAEDNDTPAAPPTDIGNQNLPADNPESDTDQDITEIYNEGINPEEQTEKPQYDETDVD
jgi:hypothetical protein